MVRGKGGREGGRGGREGGKTGGGSDVWRDRGRKFSMVRREWKEDLCYSGGKGGRGGKGDKVGGRVERKECEEVSLVAFSLLFSLFLSLLFSISHTISKSIVRSPSSKQREYKQLSGNKFYEKREKKNTLNHFSRKQY